MTEKHWCVHEVDVLTLSFPSHIKLSKLLTSIFSSQLTHGEGPKKI